MGWLLRSGPRNDSGSGAATARRRGPAGRSGKTDTLDRLIDYLLNLDAHLAELVEQLGAWVYAAIAFTIFAETGLVVTPWLPGESLLLTSGTLAGAGILDIAILAPLLFAAAFLGDVCNFLIGRYVGRRVLRKPRRFPKPEHMARAEDFYARHGAAAIILGRYVPIVRTLAPFVAGMAGMPLKKLAVYAVIAEGTWVVIFLGAGYWFGTAAWVQEYLGLALAAIVLVSLLPGAVAYLARRLRRRNES